MLAQSLDSAPFGRHPHPAYNGLVHAHPVAALLNVLAALLFVAVRLREIGNSPLREIVRLPAFWNSVFVSLAFLALAISLAFPPAH